ncbi:MAG: response regulator [Aeromicrobium sp.]|jgi:DNA-binding response OmpR family regulator|nr:response regulator [Aeromicrobium sp.]
MVRPSNGLLEGEPDPVDSLDDGYGADMGPAVPPESTWILLVEDDEAIRTTLTRGLTEQGATVTTVGTAVEAIRVLSTDRPDAVMLDLGLPDLDGSDVLVMIRATSQVPVVIATARDDEREIVRLLDAGADDYLVKPFSATQAMARIRAVLRRTAPVTTSDRRVVVGDLVIDPVSRVVALDGEPVTLNRKEFDLLLALATRAGDVVSKRQLLAEVWQMPWGGADRTVDVHLSWLRRKLGETAAQPVYLHSVRGVGLKLVDPSQP